MHTSIRTQMFSLAMPVVLSSLLQRAVGIVDIFLVGGLGASAIPAVGIAQVMVFLVMSIAWGINVGATVLVSQLWGADRKEEAGRAGFQAMLLGLAAAAGITVIGHLYGGKVAELLGANREVQQILEDYTGIIFSFIGFTLSINVLSDIMHGAGDTRTPLAASLIVNILHVFVAYPLKGGHEIVTVNTRSGAVTRFLPKGSYQRASAGKLDFLPEYVNHIVDREHGADYLQIARAGGEAKIYAWPVRGRMEMRTLTTPPPSVLQAGPDPDLGSKVGTIRIYQVGNYASIVLADVTGQAFNVANLKVSPQACLVFGDLAGSGNLDVAVAHMVSFTPSN